MIEVNLYIVGHLIGALAMLHLADEEVDELCGIDANNEAKVKELFRRFLVPEFESFEPKNKQRLKEALKYLLCFGNDDLFQLVTNMNEPPFEFPDPPIKYFIWLWEELFDDESYKIENINQYIVNNKFGTNNYFE